jgi:hypothetical protein
MTFLVSKLYPVSRWFLHPKLMHFITYMSEPVFQHHCDVTLIVRCYFHKLTKIFISKSRSIGVNSCDYSDFITLYCNIRLYCASYISLRATAFRTSLSL